MIAGYDVFRDERDGLRLQLRSEIARQTLDQSLRGRSVWKAFLGMGEQSLCTADGTPRTAREMWRDSYRIARKRDAAINKSIQAMTSAWVDVFVNQLVKPRKIDELLGRPSGF
jgi:hypothetical protein